MEKSEGFNEIVEVKQSHSAPIATWSGTIEVEYQTNYQWEIRLYNEYVVVVFPDVSAVRRGKHSEPRASIVASTRRYYGPLHWSLLDLMAARAPTEDEVLDLLCQYHGRE